MENKLSNNGVGYHKLDELNISIDSFHQFNFLFIGVAEGKMEEYLKLDRKDFHSLTKMDQEIVNYPIFVTNDSIFYPQLFISLRFSEDFLFYTFVKFFNFLNFTEKFSPKIYFKYSGHGVENGSLYFSRNDIIPAGQLIDLACKKPFFELSLEFNSCYGDMSCGSCVKAIDRNFPDEGGKRMDFMCALMKTACTNLGRDHFLPSTEKLNSYLEMTELDSSLSELFRLYYQANDRLQFFKEKYASNCLDEELTSQEPFYPQPLLLDSNENKFDENNPFLDPADSEIEESELVDSENSVSFQPQNFWTPLEDLKKKEIILKNENQVCTFSGFVNLLFDLFNHLKNNNRITVEGSKVIYLIMSSAGPIPACGILKHFEENIEFDQFLYRGPSYGFPDISGPNISEKPLIRLFRQGCGDCTLISLPILENRKRVFKRIMIDGGWNTSEKAQKKHGPNSWWPTIRNCKNIDIIFVTHSDSDHIGGIAAWAQSYSTISNLCSVGAVVMTCQDIKNAFVNDILVRSKNELNSVINYWKNLIFGAVVSNVSAKIGKYIEIFIIWPTEEGRNIVVEDQYNDTQDAHITNGHSQVILIAYKQKLKNPWMTFLFTGDASYENITQGLDNISNILKDFNTTIQNNNIEYTVFTYMDIPHHGSIEKHTAGINETFLTCFFKKYFARNYGYSYNGEFFPTTMLHSKVFKNLSDNHKKFDNSVLSAKVYTTFEKFNNLQIENEVEEAINNSNGTLSRICINDGISFNDIIF